MVSTKQTTVRTVSPKLCATQPEAPMATWGVRAGMDYLAAFAEPHDSTPIPNVYTVVFLRRTRGEGRGGGVPFAAASSAARRVRDSDDSRRTMRRIARSRRTSA